MALFETVADEYERGRPDHALALYDALGSVDGALVLEGGAGTGIATRQLVERGAIVIPFDIGREVLRRAVGRSPGLPAVLADGARLPFRDECTDLICFAQSWHWLDHERRCAEAARVLRPGGRWAGWWTHARGDAEDWFNAHWDAIEAACPGVSRTQRDIDFGATVSESGLFVVAERMRFRWVSQMTVDKWLVNWQSTSYIAALGAVDRSRLLEELTTISRTAFPTGVMEVPFETSLWVAELAPTARSRGS